jgi:hypothetical protein
VTARIEIDADGWEPPEETAVPGAGSAELVIRRRDAEAATGAATEGS